jgi:hypothetical protein
MEERFFLNGIDVGGGHGSIVEVVEFAVTVGVHAADARLAGINGAMPLAGITADSSIGEFLVMDGFKHEAPPAPA